MTSPITLYGSTRPTGDTTTPGTPIGATGDTYDDALANLKALVPAGHQLLGISTWP